MSAKVQFGVGSLIDPTEALQKSMGNASSIIGEMSKNYLLEEQFNKRMEEERRQAEETNVRADKALLVRKDEFAQEMTLRKVADERDAEDHKYKIQKHERDASSYSAANNLMMNNGVENALEDAAVAKYAQSYAEQAVDGVVGRMGNDVDKAHMKEVLLPGFLKFYKEQGQEGIGGEVQKQFREKARDLLSKEEVNETTNQLFARSGLTPEHAASFRAMTPDGVDYAALDTTRTAARDKAIAGKLEIYKLQSDRIASAISKSKLSSGDLKATTDALTVGVDGSPIWDNNSQGDSDRINQGVAQAIMQFRNEFSEREIADAATLVVLRNKSDGQTEYNLSIADTVDAVGKVLSERPASESTGAGKELDKQLKLLAESYETSYPSARNIAETQARNELVRRTIGNVAKPTSRLDASPNNPTPANVAVPDVRPPRWDVPLSQEEVDAAKALSIYNKRVGANLDPTNPKELALLKTILGMEDNPLTKKAVYPPHKNRDLLMLPESSVPIESRESLIPVTPLNWAIRH